MKYVFPEYKENVVLGNGKLQLNPMSYQVIYEGKEIDLTPREFEVLYLLALKPNWVMPKTNIYHSVWGIYYHDDQIPYRTVEYVILNNPVPVSLLSGDRKPQIRFLGNHPSGSGNLYHKSFRM